MPKVLINYRREDTAGHAGRLYDLLAQQFGPDNVFMDIDTIAPGADFLEAIREAVTRADVVITLIGRQWLSVGGRSGQRRLDEPEDFVRVEIETALERGIRVIPVLVQGASMPASSDLPAPLAPLARRNAFRLDDIGFRRDLSALIEVLALSHAESTRMEEAAAVRPLIRRSSRALSVVLLVFAAIILAGGISWIALRGREPPAGTATTPPAGTATIANSSEVERKSAEVERKSAYNVIQIGAERALLACTQFELLKRKEAGLRSAKLIEDTNLEEGFKKQIQDHRTNIGNAVTEYSGYLDQLAKVTGAIVVEEFDEYRKSLEKKAAFHQSQIARLMKTHYELQREGNRRVNVGMMGVDCEGVLGK